MLIDLKKEWMLCLSSLGIVLLLQAFTNEDLSPLVGLKVTCEHLSILVGLKVTCEHLSVLVGLKCTCEHLSVLVSLKLTCEHLSLLLGFKFQGRKRAVFLDQPGC